MSSRPPLSPAPQRGSVLIIVLITMLFAVSALTIFIEKASTDLIVATRDATDTRLRAEAYSALETTVAVLNEFRDALGGLRSPSEGWGEPLEFAGYEAESDREVTVTFEDESGKLSLPRTDAPTLVALFKSWELSQQNAERLADAMLGWMNKNHNPTSVASPTPQDYDRGETPFQPPFRSLRSFSELAAIEYAREVLYDEQGQPNDLWRRFVNTFSLYDFDKPNANAAPPDVLDAFGSSDSQQRRQLDDYRQGRGMYQAGGAGVFKNSADIAGVLGAQSAAASKLGTEISALRVIITVQEGNGRYQLAALLAPPGGARPPGAGNGNEPAAGEAQSANPPTPERNGTKNNRQPNAATGRSSPQPKVATSKPTKSLNYPFTLLEIRENGAIPKSASSTTPSP